MKIKLYHKNRITNKKPKFRKTIFYRKELDFDLKTFLKAELDGSGKDLPNKVLTLRS